VSPVHERIIAALRADPKREVYQTCKYTTCCITYTGDSEYSGMEFPIADAQYLERSNVLKKKYPERPDLNVWVLR
jgi:hypothetical protein